MNPLKDFTKQGSRYQNLCQLKRHIAPVLYTALAYKGFFPTSWLATLNADGTKLPSHADARSVPSVDATDLPLNYVPPFMRVSTL